MAVRKSGKFRREDRLEEPEFLPRKEIEIGAGVD
jgi:hypothetical protein